MLAGERREGFVVEVCFVLSVEIPCIEDQQHRDLSFPLHGLVGELQGFPLITGGRGEAGEFELLTGLLVVVVPLNGLFRQS